MSQVCVGSDCACYVCSQHNCCPLFAGAPQPSRYLSKHSLDDDDDDDDDDVEEPEVEDELSELFKKTPTVLETMLVQTKTDMNALQQLANNDGRTMLKRMLKDKEISKEQASILNGLLLRVNELSSVELKAFKTVIDAHVAAKITAPDKLCDMEGKAAMIEKVSIR